jgi:hypothetical protein
MARVVITGWREGMNKVQLNHLLRVHAGYGLGEAKHAVDALLDGETLTFECSDLASASVFCLSACAIGADCNTSTESDGYFGSALSHSMARGTPTLIIES